MRRDCTSGLVDGAICLAVQTVLFFGPGGLERSGWLMDEAGVCVCVSALQAGADLFPSDLRVVAFAQSEQFCSAREFLAWRIERLN